MSDGNIAADREVWLPVPSYVGFYDVSNFGRVRRSFDAPRTPGTCPGRELRPVMTNGYLIVSLSRDGIVTNHRLHRLVLTALQRATLSDIDRGSVYQLRFGYGAWRIQGASPTVVGRLISLGLAEWSPLIEDRRDCLLTEAGRALVEGR